MIKLLKAGFFESTEKFKNREITPERKVKCYEIELFVDGEGKSFVDDTAFPHEKGNLLFAKPGQRRHSEKKFSCFYIKIYVGNREKELLDDIITCFKVKSKLSFSDLLGIKRFNPIFILFAEHKHYVVIAEQSEVI